MSVDKTNIILYFEDALNEFIEDTNLDKETEDIMVISKEMIKRDASEDNLKKQLGVIQPILDKLFKTLGNKDSLTILQARINQLRSFLGLVD